VNSAPTPSLQDFGAVQTERLIVRPLDEADLGDLLVMNGDAEVTRYLPYATWAGMDDARAWLKRMRGIEAGGTAIQLVIEQRSDGRAIGTVLLFKWDAASARIELGYVLTRAAWGRGLMHEALVAVIARCFAVLGLRRIEAEIDPRNAGSARTLQRLGFVPEGLLRERWHTKGQISDSALYGLLASDSRPSPGLPSSAPPRPDSNI
jgi:[ribosomal protein S5]-alanine N-acetyltransferase